MEIRRISGNPSTHTPGDRLYQFSDTYLMVYGKDRNGLIPLGKFQEILAHGVKRSKDKEIPADLRVWIHPSLFQELYEMGRDMTPSLT